MSEALIILIFFSIIAPASAAVSRTAQIAWIVFAVFIVLFIAGALYVRHRRTQRAFRPRDGNVAAPVAVDAWSKAAPPKDNGKAGSQTVGGGVWERDC